MINFTLLATKAARPKKGATRKAPPPPPPKSSVPVWLWLGVIVLIAGFVFLLMKLAKLEQNSPTPNVSAVQQPAAPVLQPLMPPAPEAQANTSAAPAPEETKPKRDNFEFYQLLQNSEVDTSHVDAYQYMPREDEESYYLIQAASYRSNEDADRMRAKLILAGLQATIKVTQSAEKGTWYRLIVGPYETRSDENRALDKLAKMGINGYAYKVKKE